MAKIERTEVVVKDKVNNKMYKVLAEQTPRKTEAGIYLYLKINQLGIQYMQEKGMVDNTVSTKAFEKWFCEKLGMPETGIGQLGDLKTESAMNQWEVAVGGNVVFPANAGIAMADTTMTKPTGVTSGDDKLVDQIRKYLSDGKTKEQIVASLMTKLSPIQAVELVTRAEQPVVAIPEVVVEPAKPEFDFGF